MTDRGTMVQPGRLPRKFAPGRRPDDTALRTFRMIGPVISYRKHRALEMLAAAGQRGRADPWFLAWFTLELLDLVDDGLATVWPETMRARGRTVEVARVRITNAGRTAIEGPARFTWH